MQQKLYFEFLDEIINFNDENTSIFTLLKLKMNHYNDINSTNNKMTIIKQNIDMVKDTMIINIDQIIERGKK